MKIINKRIVWGFVLSLTLACNYLSSFVSTPTPKPTPTSTATPTLQPTATASRTPRPSPTPTLAPTIDPAARERFLNLKAIVDGYVEADVIPSTYTTFKAMPDYSDELADLNVYRWLANYDKPIAYFMVRADILMETSKRASSQSGCGFVFNLYDVENHNYVFLEQSGSVVYGHTLGKSMTKYYGVLSNPAQFTLILIAYNQKVRVVVNGQEVLADDKAGLSHYEHVWGPALKSGSSEDFGTRCKFTNILLSRFKAK